MKNLFLTLVITIFSILSGLSQKYLLRYQGAKFAKCPIDECGYLKNYKKIVFNFFFLEINAKSN